jgi:hypothetical protein
MPNPRNHLTILTILLWIIITFAGGLFLSVPILIQGGIAHMDCLKDCASYVPPVSYYHKKALLVLIASTIVGAVPFVVTRFSGRHLEN